jgi:hypothetical protein
MQFWTILWFNREAATKSIQSLVLLLSNKPTFLAFHQAVVAGFYAFQLRFKVFLEYLLVCFQQSTTRHFRH